MVRFFTLLWVVAAACSTWAKASDEVYFSFSVRSSQDLFAVPSEISIDRFDRSTGLVHAYARAAVWEAFQFWLQTGVPTVTHWTGRSFAALSDAKKLAHPSETGEPPRMGHGMQAEDDLLAAYPTYSSFLDVVEGLARLRPDLCSLIDLGESVAGRRIVALKISDSVEVDEDEPEVLLDSAMHGDELVGVPVLLKLAQTLLTEYDSNSTIAGLVDNTEIWIIPLRNPDGTYAGGDNTVWGSRRYNSRSVDLNRNLPEMNRSEEEHTGTVEQENLSLIELVKERDFVVGVNIHGGAEVINYPWDSISQRHPDDAWFRRTSRAYVDSAHAVDSSYMTDCENGITNGYDWYSIWGGEQDYMTYHHGTRMVTLEISTIKRAPADSLRRYWELNRDALLGFIAEAQGFSEQKGKR